MSGSCAAAAAAGSFPLSSTTFHGMMAFTLRHHFHFLPFTFVNWFLLFMLHIIESACYAWESRYERAYIYIEIYMLCFYSFHIFKGFLFFSSLSCCWEFSFFVTGFLFSSFRRHRNFTEIITPPNNTVWCFHRIIFRLSSSPLFLFIFDFFISIDYHYSHYSSYYFIAATFHFIDIYYFGFHYWYITLTSAAIISFSIYFFRFHFHDMRRAAIIMPL